MTHVKSEFSLRRLTSSILFLKCVGELEFVSCEPHTYSSIPPHTALLHSFVRPPAGSSVVLRCVRRSEVFITHAAVSTALAHSSMCVPPLTPSSQSLLHYTCTLARTLIDRTHFAFFPVTVHTFLFIFIMIYFSVFCLESIAPSVALPFSPWTSPQNGVGICRQPKVGITILRKCLIRSSSPGITEYESDLQMEEFQI